MVSSIYDNPVTLMGPQRRDPRIVIFRPVKQTKANKNPRMISTSRWQRDMIRSTCARSLNRATCVATSQAFLHDPAAFGGVEEREGVAAGPSVTHPKGTLKTLRLIGGSTALPPDPVTARYQHVRKCKEYIYANINILLVFKFMDSMKDTHWS